MVVIPFKGLEHETLNALLEEIASREGTDYGDVELSLKVKISQMLHKLESGIAVLCFDELTESCALLAKDDVEEFL